MEYTLFFKVQKKSPRGLYMTLTQSEQLFEKLRQKSSSHQQCDMNCVASIVLGGGQGSRLYPLTRSNCKPAMNFGGKYRLIDVPMSNAIHSGCNKIFIVTQFLSKSLHDHIFKTYRPEPFNRGFIEILTVEEKPNSKNWFQGTADAVRQNLDYLTDLPVDYFLILSGDQLYQMNYQKMMHVALQTHADVIIAALPVEEHQTQRLGILKTNQEGWITDFIEKPKEKCLLEKYRLPEGSYLGSMGIYLFKKKALLQLLRNDLREDFGKHLLPTLIEKGRAAAYIHQGYWEDIGTIESYYHANIGLTKDSPSFNWNDEQSPLMTHSLNLPAPKIFHTEIHQSIICEGSIVEAKEISHSILGPCTRIKKGSVIRESYVIGNDFYASSKHNEKTAEPMQIGENCFIERAIIDKQVYIGNNVTLVNQNKIDHYNSDDVFIRDGIIVVPRGACLPDGFTL